MVRGAELAELAGNRMTGGEPDRLLTLQIGDAAHEQVVLPAYGAPDGECDKYESVR